MKSVTIMGLAVAVAAVLLMTTAQPASAEVNEVRFARNLGLGYLQLYVMQEQKLVEKYAREAGLGEVSAKYTVLGQPTTINDALLSGSVEFGAAGITPFITLWDKSRGEVKGVAALNSQPAFLNTTNPNVHSLKDFTDKDRIAVPAVKVAYQATILQIAAEQVFGQYDKLDTITVGMSHPDATAALLSGRSEVDAHFTSPPFQYQQLEDPKVHRVMSSYDILGGLSTFSGLYTTRKFHDANPGVYKAVLAAVEDANTFIKDNPLAAAEIYVRIENSNLAPAYIEKMLRDPDIQYTIAPQNITKYTSFMARVGTIAKAPQSWKDLFFPEIHHLTGS
jgi:NitT/TauT family transport system substrate-binding protein